MKMLPAVLALLLLAGCSATGPVLYPNTHLQQVGEPQAQKDIAECETLAEQYVKSDAGKEAAKSTAIGGAGGAVIGGAAGAAAGSFGRVSASAPRPGRPAAWCTASSKPMNRLRCSRTS